MHFNKPIHILIFSIIIIFTQKSYSQNRLKIDTTYEIQDYIKYILNNEKIKVDNIKYRGLKSAIGKFRIDTNALGIMNGIVLSTGNVNTIKGGNQTPGTSGLAWDNSYRFKSDRDLNRLSKGKVSDQVILEFDFIPLENHVTFKYIFGSEEYKEYVGSRFNDVFGFIVTGDNNFSQNLALVPGKKEPVTVNNINHVKNMDLFVNNNCFENYGIKKDIDEYQPREPFIKEVIIKLFGSKKKDFVIDPKERKNVNNFLFENIEFDGFTRPLEASIFLTPYKVYHMKIALGDVGDPMFDSGVFLEAESFTATKNMNAPFFKNYEDMKDKINFDSLFHIKFEKPIVIDSPPQIEEKFEITNVNFDVNKSIIPDTSNLQIRELALYLIKNKDYRVHLLGYTDNVGSLEHNQKLSERRSKAVKELLVKSGVHEDRINYIGNNYENPLADNAVELGRRKNRRVEIVVLED